MEIREFQEKIEAIYFERASARGLSGPHMWFMEEVGALTRALRRDQRDDLEGEFADVFAWLSTLASIAEVDLEDAVRKKYEGGCPRCEATPCACG